MFKPQMLEAIFVAGSVLAGIAGPSCTKAVVAICHCVKPETHLPWHIIDPRTLRDPIGAVESLSKIPLYR